MAANADYSNLLWPGLIGVGGTMLGLPPQIAAGLAGVFREEGAISSANAGNEARWNAALGLHGYDPSTGQTGAPRNAYDIINAANAAGGGPQALNNAANANNYGIGGRLQSSLANDRMLGQQGYGSLTNAMVRGYDTLGKNTANAYQGLGNAFTGFGSQLGGYGDNLANALRTGYQGLGSGYAQRESDVLGRIQGLGATERANINEQYDSAANASDAALRARGLGASTLLSGARTQAERGRSRALGSLNESLRAQEANAISGMRGEQLAAQERGLQGVTNLGESNLGRMYGIGMAGLGAQERGIGIGTDIGQAKLGAYGTGENARINFLLGNSADSRNADTWATGQITSLLGARNDIVPNTNAWPALGQSIGNYMQTQAIKNSQPSGWDSFIGGAAGGLGQAAGTIPFLFI